MLFYSDFKRIIERLTKGVRVITTDHGYSHDGVSYTASVADINLANNASIYYSLTTPSVASGKVVHLKAVKTEDVVVSVYEGASSTAGTAYTPYNQNRLSANVSACTLKSGVTQDLTGGVIIRTYQGSAANSDHELLLKKNTEYIFHMKNIKGSVNNAYLEIFWYEEV